MVGTLAVIGGGTAFYVCHVPVTLAVQRVEWVCEGRRCFTTACRERKRGSPAAWEFARLLDDYLFRSPFALLLSSAG